MTVVYSINALLHRYNELEQANSKLHRVMEEMLEKVASRNAEIKDTQVELGGISSGGEKIKITSPINQNKLNSATADLGRKTVQISQLKKLVDHLRSGAGEGEGNGGAKKKPPPLEWAMSYEEVQDQLDKERGRNRQLTEELRQARSRALSEAACVPLEESDVRALARRRPVAQTAHAIPHNFHRCTHMKAGQRCPVCGGSLPLCRAVSQCRFCHRTVHVGCEEGVGGCRQACLGCLPGVYLLRVIILIRCRLRLVQRSCSGLEEQRRQHGRCPAEGVP